MKFINRNKTDKLMLLNVIYHKPSKYNDYTDYLDVIYRDLRTGEKYVECIPEPKMEIYFVQPEHRTFTTHVNFIELDKTYPKVVKYKDLLFEIAKEAGPEYIETMKELTRQRRFRERGNIHKYKYVFGSDMAIENWYRNQWELEYGNNEDKKITKAYLDIETDAIDIPEGYGESGECPINAVTIIYEDNKTVYTFLLRNDRNPQIEEFETNIQSFIGDLHESFDDSYGVFDYRIYMYDEEIDLITDIFKLLNTLKPDFCMVWNMRFDIPYIINRIKRLGYDPVDIMCHKDFDVKELYFHEDTKNFKIDHRGDYFTISSYTTFLDQMVVYGSLRKGQSEIRSFSLSYISQLEIKDDKLDYSEEASMKTFAYVNFKKFVLYNIKDVLLQVGIERKTSDIENVYLRSINNVTDYKSIFKQTVFLVDRAYLEYYLQGFIMGNNLNIQYGYNDEEKDVVLDIGLSDDDEDESVGPKKDEKFSGAIVADPELNEHTGITIMGMRSKYAYNNVVDMDYSAMYPHMIITFNISASTMIGKLICPYKPKGKEEEEKYDAGQDLVDNLLTDNVLNFGTKWLDLPDGLEIQKLIESKLIKK